jgi:hypothetical protein
MILVDANQNHTCPSCGDVEHRTLFEIQKTVLEPGVDLSQERFCFFFGQPHLGGLRH